MNNYEDWAHLVARKLKGEADVIAAIEKDELDDAAATDAFVRTVLKPFLPESYGIGAGRIVDAFGNRSDFMDVVIYNRSFPRIGLRGTQSDFLYESVLASFVIRAKYVRKTFFDSMDACASMARLMTNIDKTVLVQLAKKNGLKPGPNQTFIHEDPLRTARFELIGSPPAFMFGFTGIKHSYRQLQENIELWIEHRTEQQSELPMRAFPAVIATQGCFAWRNAAPLALSNREMLGVGNDEAPVRLIVLQLLYLLNRRLHVTTDGYGLKPNLSAYLGQFKPPKFELGIGDIDALVKLRLADDQKQGAQQNKRLQAAKDHSSQATSQAPQESAKKSVANPVQQAPSSDKPRQETPAAEHKTPAQSSSFSGTFNKPSPFASAPRPAAADSKPAETEPVKPYKAPSAPLGSAPIPGIGGTTDKAQTSAKAELDPMPLPELDDSDDLDEAPAKSPTAAHGSAPVPPSRPIPSVVPPKPAVDIELTGDIEIDDEAKPAAKKDDSPPDFEATMIIAPDATLSNKKATNSNREFIDRVKEQLSSPDSADAKEEAFEQTTRL